MESPRASVQSGQTVLVVEDDASIRTLLAIFLESLGYRELMAVDGLEAVALLEKHEVDVIVTDFQMPRMDGIELLHWCRTRHLHTPVIFMSANAIIHPKEKIALGDCCASLLAKPFDVDTLTAALNAAVKRDHHPNCLHV